MNINIFDSAIIIAAIAGGITGALVSIVVTLGLIRRERRAGYTFATHQPTSGGWRMGVGALTSRMQRRAPVATPAAPGTTLFDRFNESGKRVLTTAQEEAVRQNHNYIGTEHLLLGLVRDEGMGGKVLRDLAVDIDKVRLAVQMIIGLGQEPVPAANITMSPRTKKVLELATVEAARLGQGQAGGEHLLLGLVDEGEGIASGILDSLHVSGETIRQKVLDALRAAGTPAPDTYTPVRVARGSATQPFDRFTDRGKQTLALAQQEAVRLKHDVIASAHIVLGLARMSDLAVADTNIRRIFGELGIELDQLRDEVAKRLPPGKNDVTNGVTLGPEARKVMQLAMDEAQQRQTMQIEPEHLVLATVRDQGIIGAQVLTRFGATAEKVRQVVGS